MVRRFENDQVSHPSMKPAGTARPGEVDFLLKSQPQNFQATNDVRFPIFVRRTSCSENRGLARISRAP